MPLILAVGSKVLHKVKGHPHWPAVISFIEGSNIKLKYFGSDESNVVKHTSTLSPLTVKNVQKFCGKNKRKDLALALEEAGVSINER